MARILTLTTSWPRFLGDTAGSFVYHWVRSLAERGHQMTVLHPGHEAPHPLPRCEQRAISYPFARSLFYGAGAPENLSASLRAWVEVPFFLGAFYRAAFQAAQRADLIVGHWVLPMGVLAAIVGRQRKIPYAAVAHSADVHLLGRLPSGMKRLVQHTTKNITLACVSPHQVETLSQRLTTPTVLPMGIEADFFSAPKARAEARARLRLSGTVVLCMGRLVPIKGIDLLLRAARGLPVCLVVAGEGPERAHLEQLAATLGVKALFFGQVSGQTRLDLFSAADIFVQPSRVLPNGRSEGMPVALLEACAAGLPVISSLGGGAPHFLLPEKEALFFASEEVEGLRACLLRLVENPSLRESLATNASLRVQDLRWEKVAKAYEALLFPGQTAQPGDRER